MKKNLKKNLTKLATLALALVMAFGFSVTVNAIDDNAASLGAPNVPNASQGASNQPNASLGAPNQPNASLGAPNRPSNRSSNLRFTNPIKADSLSQLLVQLLRVVTMLGAIVVVFFIIWSGFKYVTARGDSKKISEATQTLTWTVVGAAVILGAQVIARAIQNTITQLGS
ncbi:MAG TPA: pilin [Candidatus Paceibacterota bacterium]